MIERFGDPRDYDYQSILSLLTHYQLNPNQVLVVRNVLVPCYQFTNFNLHMIRKELQISESDPKEIDPKRAANI